MGRGAQEVEDPRLAVPNQAWYEAELAYARNKLSQVPGAARGPAPPRTTPRTTPRTKTHTKLHTKLHTKPRVEAGRTVRRNGVCEVNLRPMLRRS